MTTAAKTTTAEEKEKVAVISPVPKQFFPHEEIDNFNEDNAHNLLLIAWNNFQKRNAISAKLIAVSESGFMLEATLKGWNLKTEVKKLVHKYEMDVKTDKEFRVYMQDLSKRSNAPCLAFGIGAFWSWFVVTIWSMAIARLYSDGTEVTRNNVFYGYYLVYQSSLLLFGVKQVAFLVLGLLVVSHTIEAIYVAYMCAQMGFGYVAVVSWSLCTLCVGYPVLTRVQHLEHLYLAKDTHVKQD